MHIRSLISPIALAAALSLSTGAMAQTEATVQMRGVDIPAEDLAEVQSRCNMLLAEANESLVSDNDEDSLADDNDNDNEDDVSDGNDSTSSDDDEISGLDQALTKIDLETITFEDCKNAGLVESNKILVK